MSNFAAVYGLARSGAFKGLFEVDFSLSGTVASAVYGAEGVAQRIKDKRKEKAEKEWNASPDRFADAPFRSPLVENYLKGGAKLVWNTDQDWESSVQITTKKGKEVSFQGKNLKKEEAAQYRNFIENKLEMIEPPSFLEKLMVANKTLAASKSGKIAGAASLGVVPAAVGVVALSARAYGATRGFVMDKLNLKNKPKDKNKQSFSERLADIKHREEYKKDLKNLPYIEDVVRKVENKKQEKQDFLNKENVLKSLLRDRDQVKAGVAASPEHQDLVKISGHPVLAEYLDGDLTLSVSANKMLSFTRHYVVYQSVRDKDPQDLEKGKGSSWEAQSGATSAGIEPYMARYIKALEMIEPPTKTELTLLKQLYQLNNSGRDSLSSRQPLVEAVSKTVDLYMTEKKKENKDFGKTNLMARLNDVRKRSIIDERLQKMVDLHSALKKNGR